MRVVAVLVIPVAVVFAVLVTVRVGMRSPLGGSVLARMIRHERIGMLQVDVDRRLNSVAVASLMNHKLRVTEEDDRREDAHYRMLGGSPRACQS